MEASQHQDHQKNSSFLGGDDCSTKSAGSSSNSSSSSSSVRCMKRLLAVENSTNLPEHSQQKQQQTSEEKDNKEAERRHQQETTSEGAEEVHPSRLFTVRLESISDEVKDEFDHVAHGNRATFTPDIVTGAPVVCCSFIIQPFNCVVDSLRKCTVQLKEQQQRQYDDSGGNYELPQRPEINTAWQKFIYYRQKLHQQNHPPPYVAKGHYHTKGDPYYELPDIFGE